MIQPEGKLIEPGYPDATCLLWGICRKYDTIPDISSQNWQSMPVYLERHLCNWAKNSAKTVGASLEDLQVEIKNRACFIDEFPHAARGLFKPVRSVKAANSKTFVAGLAYQNEDGMLAPREKNGMAITFLTWLKLDPLADGTILPTNLTRARVTNLEREIRMRFIEELGEPDTVESNLIVHLRRLVTRNAALLKVGDAWTRPVLYSIPHWDTVPNALLKDAIVEGYKGHLFENAANIKSKDISGIDDNDRFEELMDTDDDGIVTHAGPKSNKTQQTAKDTKKSQQLGGGRAVARVEVSESEEDDGNEDNSSSDDSGDDGGDDDDVLPIVRQYRAKLWRYGHDSYVQSDQKLEEMKSWPWHKFKEYRCVRGQISRAALPPQGTIFGHDVTGELLVLHQNGEITAKELRKWYPGVFSSQKCGVHKDLPPLGLPYVIDNRLA
jgi:hypothetical protein